MANKKNEKRVTINVSAKEFNVKCGLDFAEFLESDIDLLSNGTKKIELKQLVAAYVKKSYENYILQRDIKKLLEKVSEEVPVKVNNA